jgi:hypothetical protein
MAKVFGKPSAFLREKSLHHLYKSTLMICGAFAMILILIQAQSFYPNKIFGFVFTYTCMVVLLILAYKFYKEDDIISDNYYRGRKGEHIIFKELTKLSDKFSIFCDVKIRHPYNIDFVVLGPTGIFAIEVKSHAGKINYANGKITINNIIPREKDFIKQAKGEAGSVADYLKEKTNTDYWIDPVLAFSNPKALMYFGLKPTDNVFVVQKDFLLKLIDSNKQRYSNNNLADIENILKQLI